MKTIFRTSMTRDFTAIPNATLRDPRLSFKARGILAMILTNHGEWEVTQSWVAAQGGESREAVIRAMKELQDAGYAVKEFNRESGRMIGVIWTFYDLPNDSSKKCNNPNVPPKSAFPESGKPESGKPESGKADSTRRSSDRRPSDRRKSPSPPLAPDSPPSAVGPDDIWAAYPLKVGKPLAMRHIQRALVHHDPEIVLGQTRAFAKIWEGADDRAITFCPNPKTWFSEERFNDDPKTWARNKHEQRKENKRNSAIGIDGDAAGNEIADAIKRRESDEMATKLAADDAIQLFLEGDG